MLMFAAASSPAADLGLALIGSSHPAAYSAYEHADARTAKRRRLLQEIPEADMLIVPALTPTVARIIVFTDVDCPYCLLLHTRRDEFARRGIEIHYLFYPRSGPSTAAFDRAVAVWCSNDRLGTLAVALRGASLPQSQCPNPVLRHYELARNLELRGTPALIAANGTIYYGARSPDDILDLVRETHRKPGRSQ